MLLAPFVSPLALVPQVVVPLRQIAYGALGFISSVVDLVVVPHGIQIVKRQTTKLTSACQNGIHLKSTENIYDTNSFANLPK